MQTLRFKNSNQYNQMWQSLTNVIPEIRISMKLIYDKLTENKYGPTLFKRRNRPIYCLYVKNKLAISIKINKLNDFDKHLELTIHDIPRNNFYYRGTTNQIIIDNTKNFNQIINDWYNQLLNEPAPIYAYQTYFRKGRLYSIDEILSKVNLNIRKEDNYLIDLDGDLINMGSNRYKTFLISGTTCQHCKLKATYFAKERHGGNIVKWHLNLYGINDEGKEVLFTKDHILPKSKGGNDKLNNFQTLCCKCNSKKGSDYNG